MIPKKQIRVLKEPLYFTESPFERMMMDAHREPPEIPEPPLPGHPCYGCGNYASPCVWPCWKQYMSHKQADNINR